MYYCIVALGVTIRHRQKGLLVWVAFFVLIYLHYCLTPKIITMSNAQLRTPENSIKAQLRQNVIHSVDKTTYANIMQQHKHNKRILIDKYNALGAMYLTEKDEKKKLAIQIRYNQNRCLIESMIETEELLSNLWANTSFVYNQANDISFVE